MKKPRVALVYDRVNKWGGAERVLLALHELFPDAPLYTSVYNRSKAPWASVFKVKTSFLQKVPFVRSKHELFALLMPKAFEDFHLKDYDVVISVTSEAAKGIKPHPKAAHICYCLTPTRYLWSGYDEYFKNPKLKKIAKSAVSYLRSWDKKAAQNPDLFIAISKEVKQRIYKYYGRNSLVLYPPLTFTTKKIVKPKVKGYFLVVSRLVPYKRVDLAIAACNELKLPLKIVGTGSELPKLKKIAGKTVEFVGSLTEEKLLGYYKNARALIFPGREDFGLVVVEAQWFGKPVIAFRGGGALETIQEGKTGIFFDQQTKDSLVAALKQFKDIKFKTTESRKQANRFSKELFKNQFQKTVSRLLKEKNSL